MLDALKGLFNSSGFGALYNAEEPFEYFGIKSSFDFGTIIMLLVACLLFYLAIVKKFEPLLLIPIAFGMLLVNIPGPIGDSVYHSDIFINPTGQIDWAALGEGGGLIDYLYLGVKLGIYPPLIFLGVKIAFYRALRKRGVSREQGGHYRRRAVSKMRGGCP